MVTKSRPPVRTAHPSADAQGLVQQLVSGYLEQVHRALGVTLDSTPTSLAFVDHHLRMASDEDRSPILGLLAAGAGAYYGELVCKVMGATWIGDGRDPRRLRLLLHPAIIHFSPVDQALEAIIGHELEPDDDRISSGPSFDTAFHLRPPPADDPDGPEHDANWLPAQLADLAPVPEEQFHSLTCRFETLQLMLELLAAKRVNDGESPREHGLDDYVQVLANL